MWALKVFAFLSVFGQLLDALLNLRRNNLVLKLKLCCNTLTFRSGFTSFSTFTGGQLNLRTVIVEHSNICSLRTLGYKNLFHGIITDFCIRFYNLVPLDKCIKDPSKS